MNHPIGVISSALSSDLRESVSASRRLGCEGLLITAFGASLRVTDLSATGRRELRQVVSSQNQRIIGLHVDLGPKGFGPGADADRLLTQLERVMQAASELGVPLVCVDVGPLPAPAQAPRSKPKIAPEQAGLILIPDPSATAGVVDSSTTAPAKAPDPALVAQVDDALRELGHRADRYSTMVAFRTELSSFAALHWALSKADCPWFGVDLDPVAVLRDDWSLDEVFSGVGTLIRHVRARDASAGVDKRTRAAVVGQGDVPWGQLVSNLDAASYRGWLTIDPIDLADRIASTQAAITSLRRHMAA